MTAPETVAQMASALAFIAERHSPDFTNGTVQALTCRACSLLAGMPQAWPCDDRAAVGRLLPDPANRLLHSAAVSNPLSDSQPYPRAAGPGPSADLSPPS